MAQRRAGALPNALSDLRPWLEAGEDFARVVAALKSGRAATIDGAWNSSAALASATLVGHNSKTVLVVLAHFRDLDSWSADLAGFSAMQPVVFPAWDSLPTAETVYDEVGGQRLRVLRQLEADTPPRLLLTTFQALLQPVPDREQLRGQRRRIKKAGDVDPEELASWLVASGYAHRDAVEIPGEFSRRGGILDVFCPDAEAPYRLEFFGDTVESIRQFAPETQRSLGETQAVDLTASSRGQQMPRGHLCEFLPPGSWTILVEPGDLQEQGKFYLERVADQTGLFSIPAVFQKLVAFPSVHVSALPGATISAEATCHLRVESVERFSGDVTKVEAELDTAAATDFVVIACHNEAERKRLGEVLAKSKMVIEDRLRFVIGSVRAGFRMILTQPVAGTRGLEDSPSGLGQGAPSGLVVLGDHELFHRDPAQSVIPRRRLESRAIDSFLDLSEDDLVVHLSHGIARYRGMQVLEKNGQTEEHLILEFSGGTRVFVPASKIDLVQKYVGGGKSDPELSKLGGTSWQNKKDRVQAAVWDMASEMIELQAMRSAQPGEAFPSDTEWQREFDAAFPYAETPDQLTTIGEIKRDMERNRPMDRLICGDVGYGKTELAIRAAFKAVDNGKQVAVLVPTTVLAEQHFRTFSQRFAEYPFVIEVISRFRTGSEQKRILERLGQGGIDVIIGTHRILSADVTFKELGLVIIDEEQRFGVEHKERLKKLRQTVDVLTLTATPIPRTLHLSLLGIRDISNLETPPQGRLAIETRIVRFDPTLLRHAILRELNREGQIYFVHNRIYDIKSVADRLQSIVPEARIVIGHGQMAEHELEETMVRFVKRDADLLVSTTIIESGLDIPSANTIFIDQADHYGLADLHQLRGRVGRYKHRAYAYLLLDGDRAVSPNAGKRLKAIEEFTELGAGFKIAMRDLEIRGAGNILGTQQSGHIASVGYELYCQLLENSVRRLKNLPVKTHLEVNIDLPWPALLPRDYVAGQKQRIEVYRRLARLRRLERLEEFRQELRDRFGPLPEKVEWLMRTAELRLLAQRWQISSIHLEGKNVKEVFAELARSVSEGTPPAKESPAPNYASFVGSRTKKPTPSARVVPANPRVRKAISKPVEDEEQTNPIDVVLTYRHPRKIQRLAARSEGRLRVVDGSTAYFRLRPKELAPLALHAALKHLLRLAERRL